MQLLAAVRDQLSLFLSRSSPLPRPRALSLEGPSSEAGLFNGSKNARLSGVASERRVASGASDAGGGDAGPRGAAGGETDMAAEMGVVAQRRRCYGCSGRFVSDALELLEQVVLHPAP